ncbi:MAG TPA: inositol monophosphatase family protein [Ktedonobacterales bacterium]|nr:inositol monophosphatase family protein [Ktedonobacterales bacterium]
MDIPFLDLTRELAIAQQAVRVAGAYLLQRLGAAQPGKVKAARDIQLDVDLGAERILLEAIQAAFPGDQILSEEAEGSSSHTHGRQWIVDPLDGSFNFQHGYPLFGSIIALQLDQVTAMGVIYLPTSDEMYTAVRGQGAFRNGSPLRISTTSSLSEAIVHVSDFSVSGDPIENQQRVQIMTTLASAVGRVRMGGTAAGDFAWLAAGWADGLVMYSTHPWDVEAGALLVEEAGGIVTRVSMPDGKNAYVGGNRNLHEHFANLVASPHRAR